MQADSSQIQSDTAPADSVIHSYLQDNLEMLLQTMRLFITKANLAGSQGVDFAAEELLGMVMNTALQKAATFDADRPPKAWILGIAANVVLQEQRRVFGRNRREVRMDDYATEEATLDWWSELAIPGPEAEILARANVARILSLVPEQDRKLVELMVIKEMNSEAVAAALGIKPGTARVRLFRALERLRKTLEAQDWEGKRS